eukprot:gnl/TRDRNA2_/TRDRNA2_71248_c0_seq1.p2 gnl/TRDRNA2_/TRDRNA2_71248_c0~~gnl/TRDRNA2_/TRDRNA2_71248_c0_seq1.p2  ORF type:complete len:111 (-),score=18.50 gnl/TRDRNA2_/TRDRNA2_71248_c0_seq1:601-933(-)
MIQCKPWCMRWGMLWKAQVPSEWFSPMSSLQHHQDCGRAAHAFLKGHRTLPDMLRNDVSAAEQMNEALELNDLSLSCSSPQENTESVQGRLTLNLEFGEVRDDKKQEHAV